jgi:2-aminobenzoate-CoA ligase
LGNGEKIAFPSRAGGCVVYRERPSASEMWSLLCDYGVTTLAANATMYRMMLRDAPQRDGLASRLALRTAMSSGEILDAETAQRFEQLVGVGLRNAVGMTPLRHAFLESMQHGRRSAPGLSVGAPLPGYEARLVALDDPGTPARPGEIGRLAVRGPTGIGYWQNLHPRIRERTTSDVVDGWSLLDDGYTRDADGWLYFAGRLDDMIVTGGRQVAPGEVEEVLASHPAVAEVAVAAAPDPIRGQAVAAIVHTTAGTVEDDALVAALQDHVRASLAGYKYPRRVVFVSELPKDSMGKIRRRTLRALLTAELRGPAEQEATVDPGLAEGVR